jgi:hypothetical protein
MTVTIESEPIRKQAFTLWPVSDLSSSETRQLLVARCVCDGIASQTLACALKGGLPCLNQTALTRWAAISPASPSLI